MRISDWSSDVCSSDLRECAARLLRGARRQVVRFENVFMRYDGGPVILRDVSFELEPGSFHFLTGGSGAGKSTLLRLLYLAARPVSGRVTPLGRASWRERVCHDR